MKKKHTILIAALMIIVSSCQKQIFTDEDKSEITVDVYGENAGLGKKLENPYSVRNMRKAVQLLMSIAPDASHPDMNNIVPNHYYVRFLPKDTAELVVLDNDTTLVLNTVPFGYENRLELDNYHDPSIPQDEITWLYAVVPTTQQLPDIQHEIIEEIYEPEDDEDELELLALKLTGNLPKENVNGMEIMSADLTDRELLGIFSKRYNPSGHVFVENINESGSKIGELPVRNAAIEVQTLWWDDVVGRILFPGLPTIRYLIY
ncbi:hypothetical protein [Sphingobacterium griseoflavum]|uniref:Uncharacterized protein n=1 Tax=Sphingobacterium griseoflavum TaxID=1474952 RepID=A0ABQ3HXE5_9SPHI|nr:hypothetical protein [Sphingobacterium griseoflavum]GHE44343.1 hypothetical protein GCM10017764_29430 [Sphingobacterium griseoflavum]